MASPHGVQRPVPDLVEDGKRTRPRVLRLECCDARAQRRRRLCRLGARAGQRAESLDVARDAVDGARVREEHGDPERAQRRQVLRCRVRPRHDEIGRERDDVFEVDHRGVGHPRQRSRFGGIVAVRSHRHDRRPGACGKEHFGGMRRETHDAPRGMRELERGSVVVDDTDRRRHRGADEQAQRECADERRDGRSHGWKRTPAKNCAPPVA